MKIIPSTIMAAPRTTRPVMPSRFLIKSKLGAMENKGVVPRRGTTTETRNADVVQAARENRLQTSAEDKIKGGLRANEVDGMRENDIGPKKSGGDRKARLGSAEHIAGAGTMADQHSEDGPSRSGDQREEFGRPG